MDLAAPYAVSTLSGTSPGYTDGYGASSESGWIFCTGQETLCYCDRIIRFGTSIGERWSSPLQPTGGFRACTVEEFGDPARGALKHCECASPDIKFNHPVGILVAENFEDAGKPGSLLIVDAQNNAIRRLVLECADCPRGTYNQLTAQTRCETCPNMMTSPIGSINISACICTAGHTPGTEAGSEGICEPCAVGKYKSIVGSSQRASCPAAKYGFTKGGVTAELTCLPCSTECDVGFWFSPCSKIERDSVCTRCTQCEKGYQIMSICSLSADAVCSYCGDNIKPKDSVWLTAGSCEWVCFGSRETPQIRASRSLLEKSHICVQ